MGEAHEVVAVGDDVKLRAADELSFHVKLEQLFARVVRRSDLAFHVEGLAFAIGFDPNLRLVLDRLDGLGRSVDTLEDLDGVLVLRARGDRNQRRDEDSGEEDLICVHQLLLQWFDRMGRSHAQSSDAPSKPARQFTGDTGGG